ncbi:MAG TPA: TonB family protein [Flavisolibacter sp.]|nr:TonB family protein [Flavisolibacter sp.]
MKDFLGNVMEIKRRSVSTVNIYTMTSQQILHSDLLDILFEGRNKLYGAYLLRKNYSRELAKAMGITLLLVLLLVLLGGSPAKEKASAPQKEAYELTALVIPEEPKPEVPKPKIQQPPAAAQPMKTDVFLDKIRPLDVTRNAVVTQDNLLTTAVGTTQVDGPISTGVQPPQLPVVTGGTGTGEPEVKKEEPPLPSRQPQFPGGANAWLNFLSRHLRPPADMDAGEKRSCLIKFSVDEEGAITHFQVVQSGGDAFDNEVIRVLKKMPRWLPAIQNGKPTAVSFTQPVTFVAQEE